MEKTLSPTLSWRRAITQSDLPSTTRHILLNLSLYMNDMGESAFPSVETQAADTALSHVCVIKHLKIARERGWLQSELVGYGDQRWARRSYLACIPNDFEPVPRVKKAQKAVNQVKGLEGKKVVNEVKDLPEGGKPEYEKVVNEVYPNYPVNSPYDAAADAPARTRIDDPDPLVNTPQPDPPSGQQDGQSSLASHSPADLPFDTTGPDGIDLDRLTGKKPPINPYTEHELSLAAAIRACGIWNGHYLDRQDTRLRVMQLAKLWAGEGLETEELAGLLKDLKDEGRQPTHVNYIARPVADYLQAKKNPVSATHTGPGHKTNNRRNGGNYGTDQRHNQSRYQTRTDHILSMFIDDACRGTDYEHWQED